MSDTSASTIAIISAVTALCAVVLGPLVSLWSANRQSRVAVLSTNRQAWINALREALAEFAALAHTISKVEDQSLRLSKAERIFVLNAKILLMLNPKESDHQQLISILNSVASATAQTMASPTDKVASQKVTTESNKIVPLAQSVLKREWERVKKIE